VNARTDGCMWSAATIERLRAVCVPEKIGGLETGPFEGSQHGHDGKRKSRVRISDFDRDRSILQILQVALFICMYALSTRRWLPVALHLRRLSAAAPIDASLTKEQIIHNKLTERFGACRRNR